MNGTKAPFRIRPAQQRMRSTAACKRSSAAQFTNVKTQVGCQAFALSLGAEHLRGIWVDRLLGLTGRGPAGVGMHSAALRGIRVWLSVLDINEVVGWRKAFAPVDQVEQNLRIAGAASLLELDGIRTGVGIFDVVVYAQAVVALSCNEAVLSKEPVLVLLVWLIARNLETLAVVISVSVVACQVRSDSLWVEERVRIDQLEAVAIGDPDTPMRTCIRRVDSESARTRRQLCWNDNAQAVYLFGGSCSCRCYDQQERMSHQDCRSPSAAGGMSGIVALRSHRRPHPAASFEDP